MTLSESAINEILFALDNGGGADLVRQLAEVGLMSALIGVVQVVIVVVVLLVLFDAFEPAQ